MVYKSDLFNSGRTAPDKPNEHKKTLSFNKFIARADNKLENDKKYDLIADFEFYNISCDRCLRNSSKVVPLYIMQTDELIRRLNRGELITADSSSILVTCPVCNDINRITDIRNTTSLSIPEHLLPENVNRVGNIGNKNPNRDKPLVTNIPEESREQYQSLLNMSKVNKTKHKELENYIKDYSNRRKLYKDKPFVSNIDAIDTAGQIVVKVEDIEINS